MAAPSTESFGKYQILERIARGGMAEIYKARMEGVGGFNRLFAIKRILPAYSQNREYIDLLVDEAKIAGLLSHANIVQILDLGQVNGQYYVAMEFINGADLGALLARCRERGITLPVPHSVFILIEVLKGLEYAHNRQVMRGNKPVPLNIVHRDISPSNVLVSFQGEVKLTDFGIAKANVKASETMSGVVKGKFDYMSPEQAAAGEVDQRTDIFAAGVLLYEMLCGAHPFRKDGELQTIEAIRKGEYRPPTEVNPDIPYGLELIIDQALTRSPEARYANATAFKEALTRFFHDAGFIFSHSTLAAFLKGLFPESGGKKKPAATVPLKDQETRPISLGERLDEEGPVHDIDSPSIAFGPAADLGSGSFSAKAAAAAAPSVSAPPAPVPAAPLADESMSKPFGPAPAINDESTLIRKPPEVPSLMKLKRPELLQATAPPEEWAEDVDTMIRPGMSLSTPSLPIPSPTPVRAEVEEEELDLEEPAARPAPPKAAPVEPARPAPAARPPAPKVAPTTNPQARPAPARPSQRTLIFMVLIGITGLALGMTVGGILGWMAAGRDAPAEAVVLKTEPRLILHLPKGAAVTLDGRPISLASPGPTEVSLAPGQAARLGVSLGGKDALEQTFTLDYNEVRIVQMETLVGAR